MSAVTKQEIVEALRSDLYRQNLEIANRIEQHGIAPPDGMAVVKAEQSADRLAIKLLVSSGFVAEEKANEALNIAHGFSKGPLADAPEVKP